MQYFIQTIVLAILQGVTELFPISSLGHTVIVPWLLGWGDITDNDNFLPMVVALHLGTSIALFLYFWRDWLQVGKTLVDTAKTRKIQRGTEAWVTWMVIIGTIPAGVLGLLFKKKLESLFASPKIAATFLVINGSLLFLGEALRRRAEGKLQAVPAAERERHFRPLKSLTIKEAFAVGASQALALIPGISRSGSTMIGGLVVRLTHEDAARFSFLLATPIILAAAVLETPKLLHQHVFPIWLIALGMFISGAAAWLSTKFLMKYFEKGRLTPFAIYCWIVGLVSLALFFIVFHTN